MAAFMDAALLQLLMQPALALAQLFTHELSVPHAASLLQFLAWLAQSLPDAVARHDWQAWLTLEFESRPPLDPAPLLEQATMAAAAAAVADSLGTSILGTIIWFAPPRWTLGRWPHKVAPAQLEAGATCHFVCP
jgi:hypothetical protein